jgi:alpha-1,3-mannosyltransferase
MMGVATLSASGDDVVRELDARLAAGERVRVAYLNAHASNVAASNAEFMTVLQTFVVLNDGVGLDIAARALQGRAFPENLNGTDFTLRFLRQTSQRFRIFLLGARPGVAEDAAEALKAALPQHVVAGTRDGYFVAAGADEVAAEIKRSGADLLLVAMGNPAQEFWIAQHLEATGCRMAIAVGALFDFLAERVPRAPQGLRRLRLEWLFRLALEPTRLWRRYLIGNPVFLARVGREWLRHRAKRALPAAQELRREG